MKEEMYVIEDGKFKHTESRGAKVDGHCHCKYSNESIQTGITKLIGVKESYTSVKRLYKTLKKKGMDFYTVSDHDVVKGALDLRKKFPKNSFINCEYTVPLEPFNNSDQFIHIGCWGLDYANNSSNPLMDHEVLDLHESYLLPEARKGYQKFIELCEKLEIPYAFNHPVWQGNPEKPLDGKQLYDLTEAFPIIEINGDLQLENLIAIELAENHKKTICAGTDAHTYLRLGNQFTVTKYPVNNPKEFIEAFKKHDIGIGSNFELPTKLDEPSIKDVVYHQFNGTIKELQKDTLNGIWNYLVWDWSLRKLAFTSSVIAAPALFLQLPSPIAEILTPLAMLGEAATFAFVPTGLPAQEKRNVAKMSKELYASYQHYLAEIEAKPLKEKISGYNSEILEKKAELIALQEEIAASHRNIDEITKEISLLHETYENKAKLPRLTNELSAFTRFSKTIMDSLPFIRGTGPNNVSQFTRPVEKKKDES